MLSTSFDRARSGFACFRMLNKVEIGVHRGRVSTISCFSLALDHPIATSPLAATLFSSYRRLSRAMSSIRIGKQAPKTFADALLASEPL